jgi:hypothetical protein
MRIWVVRACDGECGEAVGYAHDRDQAITMILRKADETLMDYKRRWSDNPTTVESLTGMDSYHADLVETGEYMPKPIESIHCDGKGNLKA